MLVLKVSCITQHIYTCMRTTGYGKPESVVKPQCLATCRQDCHIVYLKVTKFSHILNLAILAFSIFMLNLVRSKPVKCMANYIN